MKKTFFVLSSLLFLVCSCAFGAETIPLWPNDAAPEGRSGQQACLEVWFPETRTTDSLLIVTPGGGYNGLAYGHEGPRVANFYKEKGIPCVILKYRTPRLPGVPKHLGAWQDAQRAIKIVRSKAAEWKINPEKIGMTGFSAGGHLTLMCATTSQTPAYAPIDELDKTPCHLNFAIPVYPAYVLEDGKDGGNSGRGNDSTLVPDFAFDVKTPPMCLIHGDADPYSPMGSVAVYHKLRTLNIPAELHIYAKGVHGLFFKEGDQHVGDWFNRTYEWLKVMGF